MAEFCNPACIPLPDIPDNLTIPQFLLDSQHPIKPPRPEGRPLIIDDKTGRRVTFEELRARTYGLASALSKGWKFGTNDVVCIFSTNHVDYPTALWAVHRLGGIISPANPAYSAEELVHQLTISNSRLLFVHPDFLSTAHIAAKCVGIPYENIILFNAGPNTASLTPHTSVDELVTSGLGQPSRFTERRLDPGEAKKKVAFLSFSSGTTGKPKAVIISHYSVISNIIQMAVHLNDPSKPPHEMRFSPGDRAAAVLPFFHIYGLVVNMHYMIFAGLSLVVIPRFNFTGFLESIVNHHITHLFLVPPQIVLFCKHPAVEKYDFSHVKFCMFGAAPMSKELTQKFMQVLPNCAVGQGYGLTESCATVSCIPASQKCAPLGSAGRLLPGVRARVVKHDGSLAQAGEEGELFVAGPAIASGYLNNEQATRETFVDGWLRTGDTVVIRADGEVFIVDRIKEIMKVRGFQVAPAELEGHLLSHPDVADVCVVGMPDEYSGELPMAWVVLGSDAAQRLEKDPKEEQRIKASIIKYVADAKVRYKRLAAGVEFTDVIPKNPSGKILRRILRERAKTRKAPLVAPKL